MNRQKLTEAYEKLEALRAAAAEQIPRGATAANHYDPEALRGTSLERAPDAAAAFQQAADPASDKPAEKPAESEQLPRTGSAANHYFPEGLRGTSLENTPPVVEAFQRAAQPEADADKTTDQSLGSEQVRNTALEFVNRPPPEMARDADRTKHNTEMQSDDASSRKAEYAAIMEKIQERQRGTDHAQERGLDHGMG